MKFNRAETVFILTIIVLLVAGILVAGFLLRPRWPSAETLAKETRRDEIEKPIELTPTEEEQQDTCYHNQASIRAAISSYKAGEGRYPPLGTINERHPLITEDYLDVMPSCPATDKKYLVVQPIDYRPPTTECPSGLETHFLP